MHLLCCFIVVFILILQSGSPSRRNNNTEIQTEMICKYIRLASAYSEKEQNRIIDDYLRKKGWVADTIVKDDTVLKAEKGKPYDQRILIGLCQKLDKSDAVLVSGASILTKNAIGELFDIVMKYFKPRGLHLIICDVAFDIDCSQTDPMTELKLHLLEAVSNMEKDCIRARTREGLRKIKAEIEENGYYTSKNGNKITRLGNGQAPSEQCLAASAAIKRKRAIENENNIKFYRYFQAFEKKNGKFSENDRTTNAMNWEKLADELNQLGYLTSSGLPFNAMRCRNAYRTIALMKESKGDGTNLKTESSFSIKMESARKKIGIDSEKLKREETKFENTVETLDALLQDEEQNSIESNSFDVSTDFDVLWPTELIELFVQNDYCLCQNQIDTFAQRHSLMANAMINQVNELYFEMLDDNLIEESEDKWILNKEYLEQINDKS